MEKRFTKNFPKCVINWLTHERHEKMKPENQNFLQQADGYKNTLKIVSGVVQGKDVKKIN